MYVYKEVINFTKWEHLFDVVMKGDEKEKIKESEYIDKIVWVNFILILMDE